MQAKFKNSKLLFWTVELVLTIIGVYFILQMPNVFSPVLKMLSAILLPLLVAGFFYYMFDPVVVFFGKTKNPKGLWIHINASCSSRTSGFSDNECDSSIGRTDDPVD